MIIRPTGYQPTQKIRTRETRRSDCKLDHCLVLAVPPDRWDVDVRSTMMDAVSCRSSVSDDVNHATRGCSRGSDADETNQQERRLREADDVRRSVSSVSDREVRTLLASRNKHNDVRPTEHGAIHPDAARHSRLTQLRLFNSEEEGHRLRLSTPPSYMEPSPRPMERETADQSTIPIRRLFVGAQPEDNRRRASRRPEEADVRPRRHRRSSPVQRQSDADDYDSSRRRPLNDSDGRRPSVVHQSSPEH